MPEYYENPLTGRVETPAPWADRAEWEAIRPYHLADTLSRYMEDLDALYGVRDALEAKGKAQGVKFTSAIESTDHAITEALAFVDELRAQAQSECGDQLTALLESSPQRRAELAAYPQRAYQRWLEARQGIARPGTANVGTN